MEERSVIIVKFLIQVPNVACVLPSVPYYKNNTIATWKSKMTFIFQNGRYRQPQITHSTIESVAVALWKNGFMHMYKCMSLFLYFLAVVYLFSILTLIMWFFCFSFGTLKAWHQYVVGSLGTLTYKYAMYML